ncbi:MAG: hypothetical protein AAFU65_02775 [Pseudomonadota bacterium]
MSYVELLTTVVVVAVLAAPVADAVRAALQTSDAMLQERQWRLDVRSALEVALATPYSELQARTGTSVTRTSTSGNDVVISIERYDVDNADGDDDTATGVDDGVRLIRAVVPWTGVRYQTLVVEK